jgi:two-component system nitrate/nitrite response regulator NarP
MARVVIADDHPFVLGGLELAFSSLRHQVVGKAFSGRRALAAIRRHGPDLAVLDVAMPDGDGISVLRELRLAGDPTPVILLTAGLDGDLLLQASELAVNGIMLKEGAEDVLSSCIDAVLAGETWIDPNLREQLEALQRDGITPPRLSGLTPRERDVVRLLTRGLRNREIATELRITEGTVKVYLHTIYDKLRVSNRFELIVLASGD